MLQTEMSSWLGRNKIHPWHSHLPWAASVPCIVTHPRNDLQICNILSMCLEQKLGRA